MAGEIAARRHAQAVFEIALEKSTLDNWRSDLDLLAEVLGDEKLLLMLESPKIRFEDKANAIAKNLTEVDEMALNLAKLLIQKRLVKIMPQISQEYGILMDRHNGIEHAEVITAIAMDFSTELKVKNQLARLTGSEIRISKQVSPDIMGGFVARVGDRVIDASIRSRLQKLKQNIAQQTI